MKELIIITEKEGQQLVDARELHEFLEVNTRFNDWIKTRIEKYDFTEKEDYVTLTENLVSGGKQVNYAISIDMAKELCMVENNKKGREARKYFIDVEKKYKKQVPQLSVTQMLELAVNELKDKDVVIQEKNQQIETMKPTVDFVENIFKPSTICRKIGEFAKTCSFSYPDGRIIGPNQMFSLLREMNILMWGNQPKSEYIKAGYFELKENMDKYSNISFAPTILITTKGQEWLYKKINKYLVLEAR